MWTKNEYIWGEIVGYGTDGCNLLNKHARKAGTGDVLAVLEGVETRTTSNVFLCFQQQNVPTKHFGIS